MLKICTHIIWKALKGVLITAGIIVNILIVVAIIYLTVAVWANHSRTERKLANQFIVAGSRFDKDLSIYSPDDRRIVGYVDQFGWCDEIIYGRISFSRTISFKKETPRVTYFIYDTEKDRMEYFDRPIQAADRARYNLPELQEPLMDYRDVGREYDPYETCPGRPKSLQQKKHD